MMDKQIKVSRFVVSEYLECQEDMDAYLAAAFESGDFILILKALENVAKARECMSSGSEMKNTENQYLSEILENDIQILRVFTTLVESLGYQLSVVPKCLEYR